MTTYRIVIAPFAPWVEGEVLDTLTGCSVFVSRLQLTAQEAQEACEEWIEDQEQRRNYNGLLEQKVSR